METKDLTSTIYLDIETGYGLPPSQDGIVPDGRLKDPEKIKVDIEEKWKKAWHTQSLHSIKGELWCIGIAVNDDEAMCFRGEDERGTMILLDDFLADTRYDRIIAHNGIEFDFLWLFHKGIKYKLKNVVHTFGKNNQLVDTMRIMDGPAWKKMVSLNNMAELLGIKGKAGIDGSMVPQMILDGKHKEIIEYCKEDVNILRKCYKALNELGLYS